MEIFKKILREILTWLLAFLIILIGFAGLFVIVMYILCWIDPHCGCIII